MGMSMHVVGFKPADDKFKKMKAVWDACKQAGISLPTEAVQFFDGNPPDERGVRVDIRDSDCAWDYESQSCRGFEVDVKKLPKDVTIIRFIVSY